MRETVITLAAAAVSAVLAIIASKLLVTAAISRCRR